MNNKVVIVSQNQSSFLTKMVGALAADVAYIVVLDRCTDDSELVCLCNNIKYVQTDLHTTGFYAGYARNYGAKDFDGNILFLDGDRVPQFKVTNEFISYYANKWDMSLLRDMSGGDTRRYLSRNDIELEIPHAQYCHIASCGMVLNGEFIKKIKILNNGAIFNPIFDGLWGCEDSQLGDIVYYHGAKVGFVSEKYQISGYDLCKSVEHSASPEMGGQYRKRLVLKQNLIRDSFNYSRISANTLFCVNPFISLAINRDTITPCNCVRSFLDFYYDDLGQCTYESYNFDFDKIWSSPVFELLRQSMKHDKHWFCTFESCSYKWLFSINDLKSNIGKAQLGDKVCNAIVSYMQNDSVYTERPLDITLNHTNACNLKCGHCRSDYILKTDSNISSYITSSFKEHPFFKNVACLTLSGTGEPFFDIELNKIITTYTKVEFPNIKQIHILTNGVLLTADKLDQLLERWNGVDMHFNVSIPGVDIDVAQCISPHIDYQKVIDNIQLLSSYRLSNKIAGLSATFVYQRENFLQLQAVIDIAEKLHFDKVNVQYVYKSYWCKSNESNRGVVTTNKSLFDKHIDNISSLNAPSIKVDINYDLKALL